MDLKSRLASAADAWCAAWSAIEGASVPLSRLSKRVVDDGKFFDNLETMRRGPSTDTLERFARFLADPANWADGEVPQEAREFAHVTGVTAPSAGSSAGIAGESSPVSERDAA